MFIRSLSLACLAFTAALSAPAQAFNNSLDGTIYNYYLDGMFGGGWAPPNSEVLTMKAPVATARTADGGYVIAVSLTGGGANGGTGEQIGLARLDHNGNLVTSGFGAGGVVTKDAWFTRVTDMVIDAQGRIVVVGAAPDNGGKTDLAVARFNPDGSDDSSFSGDGATQVGIDENGTWTQDIAYSVLAEPDGRLVLVGNTDSRFAVVRLLPNGDVDHSFGSITDGQGGARGTASRFLTDMFALGTRVMKIVDGRYVVAGSTMTAEGNFNFAARVLGSGGQLLVNAGSSASFAVSMLDAPIKDNVLSDAVLVDPITILLAGTTADSRFAATRIKVGPDNGGNYTVLNWDTSFVGSGIANRAYRYFSNPVASPTWALLHGAAVDADGNAWLVGDIASTLKRPAGAGAQRVLQPAEDPLSMMGKIVRLKPDGSPDQDWNSDADGSNYYWKAPADFTNLQDVVMDGAMPVVLGSYRNDDYQESPKATMIRLVLDRIFADNFDFDQSPN
ncbi:MAG: hypothetical protein IT467_07160 [Dokdonella sp.]|uniref:hypothetical protein n=1 Tax=Dokdonella sp. TaxID=2291710 RepID=UPI0025C0E4B0|nr:hypothetical protein [Dokdonella sp.]MBZ0223589.1 hypothetical protein [Dokdonella sp.]MCC7255696.1 hypothetical protein [Dokdonella sp.]